MATHNNCKVNERLQKVVHSSSVTSFFRNFSTFLKRRISTKQLYLTFQKPKYHYFGILRGGSRAKLITRGEKSATLPS